METIAANDAAHNEVQQLHDKYEAVLALRDAHRNNPEMWRKLDHEQKKVFRAYLFALQGVTMRSNPDSYYDDQKLGRG